MNGDALKLNFGGAGPFFIGSASSFRRPIQSGAKARALQDAIAIFQRSVVRASVLECGGLPPLWIGRPITLRRDYVNRALCRLKPELRI